MGLLPQRRRRALDQRRHRAARRRHRHPAGALPVGPRSRHVRPAHLVRHDRLPAHPVRLGRGDHLPDPTPRSVARARRSRRACSRTARWHWRRSPCAWRCASRSRTGSWTTRRARAFLLAVLTAPLLALADLLRGVARALDRFDIQNSYSLLQSAGLLVGLGAGAAASSAARSTPRSRRTSRSSSRWWRASASGWRRSSASSGASTARGRREPGLRLESLRAEPADQPARAGRPVPARGARRRGVRHRPLRGGRVGRRAAPTSAGGDRRRGPAAARRRDRRRGRTAHGRGDPALRRS